MERNLFRYILKRSKKEQLFIVLLTVLSLPFYYLSLEMPKLIVNKALGASVTAFPHSLNIFGFEVAQFGQIPWLLLLCFIFLLAVLITGGLKYKLNVYKGLLGERLLRQLRRELSSRMLRFPLAHFRRISPGEINAMVTQEVEPLGGFIGDAFAVPLLQGGLLLTAMLFIFMQDPVMGVAAVALFPVQAYVIPKLRREVLELSRERVKEVRRLSTRIGDAVAMTREIRTNGAGTHELSALDQHFQRLLDIRYRIFRRKFFVKFLNNFLFQLTPFLFLLIGGYLVIQAELTMGALVAILLAYKDLPPPGKELLDYYQTQQDVHIKYEQVVAQFAPPGMYAPDFLLETDMSSEPLRGDIVVQDLAVVEEGATAIDNVSFRLRLDEHIAILGASERMGRALTQALVRLVEPDGGTIVVGGRKLQSLSHAFIGRRFTYIDADPAFLTGTVEENLFYGHSTESSKDRRAEALRVIKLAEMENDMCELGLQAVINPARHPGLTARLLVARHTLRERLSTTEARTFFESFDRRKYCTHASIVENLLFGEPLSETLTVNQLAENRYIMSIIKRARLLPDLVRIGCRAATAVLDAQSAGAEVPEDEQGQPLVYPDELPSLRAMPERVSQADCGRLSKSERRLLLSIAFKVVAARHRFCRIDEMLQERIVQARERLIRRLPSALRGQIAFFDPEIYNQALTIQDNLMFGRAEQDQPDAMRSVGAEINAVLAEYGLHQRIVAAGLEYHVGVGGGRLTASQRQRLAIARGLLKRPEVFIACRATDKLDSASEEKLVENLVKELRSRCVIWVLDNDILARHFDRLLVFQDDHLLAEGTYSEWRSQQARSPQVLTSKQATHHE